MLSQIIALYLSYIRQMLLKATVYGNDAFWLTIEKGGGKRKRKGKCSYLQQLVQVLKDRRSKPTSNMVTAAAKSPEKQKKTPNPNKQKKKAVDEDIIMK